MVAMVARKESFVELKLLTFRCQLFFFFFYPPAGWGKIKLQLPHFQHVLLSVYCCVDTAVGMERFVLCAPPAQLGNALWIAVGSCLWLVSGECRRRQRKSLVVLSRNERRTPLFSNTYDTFRELLSCRFILAVFTRLKL